MVCVKIIRRLTGLALALLLAGTVYAEQLPFVDVPSDSWFAPSVEYVYHNGLMNGVGEDTFQPNSSMSRGMIVTVLHRLEGKPAASAAAPFSDVAASAYYSDAVAWSYENGIVKGTSDTAFSPNGNVTREQLVTIFFRYAAAKEYDVSARAALSEFSDVEAVHSYALDAVRWAVAEGIISGVNRNTLAPGGEATRAQFATIVQRFVLWAENQGRDSESQEELGDTAAISSAVTVEASGELVKSNDYAIIDYSNTDDGYVMVCYTAQTSQRLKVQVKGPSTTYTYNLTQGEWAAFPLSDENGDYQIVVYENVVDSKYAAVLSLSLEVTMTNEFAPFLHSNQYVDFDHAPKTVAKAGKLVQGVTDSLAKVERIYNFVVGNLAYDTELAATVQSGYTPDLDVVLEKMSGICFDYAALMTGMLRSQGVPAKLVVGYAGDVYHAWISVWSEKTGWVDGVIYFDGVSWQRMDPTFAANGGSGIEEYIGNGNNYTAKYFY